MIVVLGLLYKHLMDKVEQLCSINNQIIKLSVLLTGDHYLLLLSIYAPNLVAKEENIAFFMHLLEML